MRAVHRLREIAPASWDALFPPDYPFTRHAFLSALEETGCVGHRTGWEPDHRVLERDGDLVAAMPLYRKQHSYGEFVFDFGWAHASHELGAPYYPKLLNAIPFTPATGPRLGARDPAARAALLAAVLADFGASASSFHALFLDEPDLLAARASHLLERHDLQFHWHNRGDASFAQFAARLTQDKRKKVLRERRRVAETGLRFDVRRGDELGEPGWAEVYALYGNTYEERGQAPYLTRDFFLDYGMREGTPLRLILARDGASLVAVAITLVGGDTLYGRHWGCAERHHSLHFETCYYQGIELCLREGLSRFDAGAQGAHKLARGFEPVITRSAHAIAEPRLRQAVAAFLERERRQVDHARRQLAERSPYRRTATASDG